MIFGPSSRRNLSWALTGAIGLAAILLPTACSTPANAAEDCIVMANMDEKITNIHEKDPNGRFPNVGGSATFTDYFYDANNKLLITDEGRALAPFKDSRGHMIEVGWEVLTLSDGTIEDGGQYDITDGFDGKWISVPAVGTSGRYLGYTGERKFLLVIPGKLLKAEIRLCKP